MQYLFCINSTRSSDVIDHLRSHKHIIIIRQTAHEFWEQEERNFRGTDYIAHCTTIFRTHSTFLVKVAMIFGALLSHRVLFNDA